MSIWAFEAVKRKAKGKMGKLKQVKTYMYVCQIKEIIKLKIMHPSQYFFGSIIQCLRSRRRLSSSACSYTLTLRSDWSAKENHRTPLQSRISSSSLRNCQSYSWKMCQNQCGVAKGQCPSHLSRPTKSQNRKQL